MPLANNYNLADETPIRLRPWIRALGIRMFAITIAIPNNGVNTTGCRNFCLSTWGNAALIATRALVEN
jgi:hypothetical protein